MPEGWDKEDAATVNKVRQKDTEAHWTEKHHETHFGYKNHVNVDAEHKMIRAFEVTAGSVHDSQVSDQLLDQSEDADGDKRPAYADSAYRSKEQEARLEAAGIESQVCEKGSRGHPLTEEQKAANHKKSKTPQEIQDPLARRTCVRRAGADGGRREAGADIWCAPSVSHAHGSRSR